MKIKRRSLLAGALLLCLAAAAPAQTDGCVLGGEITAAPNTTAPGLGAWEYTLTVNWDTGRYGLSHLNLLVDEAGNCDCLELGNALHWASPAGVFDTMSGDCPVDSYAQLECGGDPSLGITMPLIKFEYDEEAVCEPEQEGIFSLVFYADYAPATIYAPNMFLVDKHALQWCEGPVTGVFPGLPCDPVANEYADWGRVKAGY